MEVVNAVCGKREGWVSVEVECQSLDNVGGVSLVGETQARRSFLSRLGLHSRPAGTRSVPVVPLDHIMGASNVNLIKLDVEGMELQCLLGAQKILRESQPVIYLEQLNTSELPPLYNLASRHGYTCYWLETHPFNRTNFRGATENLWWRTETGILAIPRTSSYIPDLPLVRREDKQPPSALNAHEGISVSPIQPKNHPHCRGKPSNENS